MGSGEGAMSRRASHGDNVGEDPEFTILIQRVTRTMCECAAQKLQAIQEEERGEEEALKAMIKESQASAGWSRELQHVTAELDEKKASLLGIRAEWSIIHKGILDRLRDEIKERNSVISEVEGLESMKKYLCNAVDSRITELEKYWEHDIVEDQIVEAEMKEEDEEEEDRELKEQADRLRELLKSFDEEIEVKDFELRILMLNC